MSISCRLFALLCAATAAEAADAIRWTPAAIATAEYESTPTFSPDGREMFFFRGDTSFRRYRLFHSRCRDGRWGEATVPAFAAPANYDEADPSFTLDGQRLYFVSTRGDLRPREEADLDIWFVDRESGGQWRAPQRMPEPVNSAGAELLPRPQPDGSIVFGSDRDEGLGGNDIYVARPDGASWLVENLGPAVNSPHDEYEAELSRDGTLLVVVADRGDRSHFYPYRRDESTWIAQPRIVPRLDVFQVGPLLSPRADRLLFAQADDGRSGELFVLDLVPDADTAWPPACGR
jgi:Tol biopolymer transport system component